ncbi:MAG: hypothetical protein ACKO1U_03725 [Bacteroidota bacterium]
MRLSPDSAFHLVQRISSRGRSEANAKERAAAIVYPFECSDSVLTLPADLDLEKSEGFRNQTLQLMLLVPEGACVRLSSGTGKLLYDVSNRQNILDRDMEGRTWRMKNGDLDCIDCDGMESVVGENDERISIDDNGLTIQDESGKSVRIDSNGIQIKH